MNPSYFKIEILAIQDEFVLLGHKSVKEIYKFSFSLTLYSLNYFFRRYSGHSLI